MQLQQVTQDVAALARRKYAAADMPEDQECQGYLIQRHDLSCCVAFLPGKTIAVGPVGFFLGCEGLGMTARITVANGLITRCVARR